MSSVQILQKSVVGNSYTYTEKVEQVLWENRLHGDALLQHQKVSHVFTLRTETESSEILPHGVILFYYLSVHNTLRSHTSLYNL